MTPKYWHDLEKTIPATTGMTVAVVEGFGMQDGNLLDASEPDPEKRPTVDALGMLNFAPNSSLRIERITVLTPGWPNHKQE